MEREVECGGSVFTNISSAHRLSSNINLLTASDYVSVSDPEDQRVQQKNVKIKTVFFKTMRANVQMWSNLIYLFPYLSKLYFNIGV